MAELDRYWLTARLPRNTYTSDRTPILEDERGRRCAVAHLVGASGDERLVARTRARLNLARIEEMDDPNLLAWASRHGLTAAELAEIQPAYSEVEPGMASAIHTFMGMSLAACVVAFVGLFRRTRAWVRTAAIATALGGILLAAAGAIAIYGPECVGTLIATCSVAPSYSTRVLIVLSMMFCVMIALWLRTSRERSEHREGDPQNGPRVGARRRRS